MRAFEAQDRVELHIDAVARSWRRAEPEQRLDLDCERALEAVALGNAKEPVTRGRALRFREALRLQNRPEILDAFHKQGLPAGHARNRA